VLNRSSIGRPAKPQTARFTLLVSLVIPFGLWAAEEPGRVEKTLDTTPNPRVSVSNVRGNVVVRGWDKSQVHALFTATSPKVGVDVEPMPPKGQADRVRFQTENPNTPVNTNGESADYSLDVPLNSTLDIQDTQGSVRVEKVQGDVHVSSVAAPISVMEALGHLHVESVGGNIEIVRASGRVEASTVNGDIRFTSLNSANLHGITTSGRIVYVGDFVPRGNYDLATYSGEVDVFCPATASFELTAKTKGKVDNEFRMTPSQRRAPSPSASFTSFFGMYHDGRATLDVRSYNGAIHIRRQP
jgi:hypothetical protein